MPGLVLFLAVVWLLKNAAMDVTYAVNGKPNPRYQLKSERARTAGRRPADPPRYGGRRYWADLWADTLEERTRLRRERVARRRAAREEADRVEAARPRLDPWEAEEFAPRPAGRRPPAAPPAPDVPPAPDRAPWACTATMFAAPHPYEFDLSATDPARQREWEMCDRPRTDPIHEVEDEDDDAPRPVLRVVRDVKDPAPAATVRADHPTKGTATMASEVIGLTQSIAYAGALAATAGEHSSAGNEGYIGHLTAAKVGGAAISTAHDMQEAFSTAQAAAERHKAELERQLAVQEQYDANPDAGDKAYQLDGR